MLPQGTCSEQPFSSKTPDLIAAKMPETLPGQHRPLFDEAVVVREARRLLFHMLGSAGDLFRGTEHAALASH